MALLGFKKFAVGILLLSVSVHVGAAAPDTIRLKELGKFEGWRENHLVGFGIVTGLAGTGDSPRSRATRQSLANFMSNFDVMLTSDQINSRNVAIVSLMAQLPPITHQGDKVDVIVTSLGDARSLVGGTLLLAPLKGPDGKVYALAQGAISVGGYRYDQNGNIAQKNHATGGVIPGGAQAEQDIFSSPLRDDGTMDFVLESPDYTTIERVAKAINLTFKQTLASVRDSSAVRVAIPPGQLANPSAFMSALETIEVRPDQRARVVINERTGTIIAGGDVKISKVTVAHGDLKVSVLTNYFVSQPQIIGRAGPNIRTQVVPNTQINVNEEQGGMVELPDASSVGDLVVALNKIKVSTRDIIAILQGIKTAGALHADLILQ
ncbi:flagellar basal body P-ring protein FlgI [Methylobacillus arboreus]|uniref:flagellar basal body P-ring protein FlgI n=1 Tax=Methylobacillus arboreus TaxID=755170 RepID=UPI001E524D22|nr:flagellar basal body P-ring protein FlgI [Methylobacillus arboreus]MCB5191877.1 flagellar basal body P-ring protein FlgI [Methylobacillus arboreus]